MGKKNKDQKGSGARKHGRNRRAYGTEFRTTLERSRYRLRHGIPQGSRKEIHRRGECPVHSK